MVRIVDCHDFISQETGREPTPSVIAKDLRMNLNDVEKILGLKKPPYSLNGGSSEDDDDDNFSYHFLSQEPGPVEISFENIRDEKLLMLLKELEKRDAQILALYFGLNGKSLTLKEIGGIFGITQERVRKIKDRAIRILRQKSKKEKFNFLRAS